jgi:hypothetical protein
MFVAMARPIVKLPTPIEADSSQPNTVQARINDHDPICRVAVQELSLPFFLETKSSTRL